jgi:hypothetical protein
VTRLGPPATWTWVVARFSASSTRFAFGERAEEVVAVDRVRLDEDAGEALVLLEHREVGRVGARREEDELVVGRGASRGVERVPVRAVTAQEDPHAASSRRRVALGWMRMRRLRVSSGSVSAWRSC